MVDELVAAYEEAKREFYLGGLRLSEVEGGRFCEAAFRLLEHITTGRSTALGTQLDTEGITRRLAAIPAANHPEAVRIHIPRSLRLVYDIRNKRDAAHLADGIDPNLQDATLVIGVLDWILAEFIRLYHKVSPNDATGIVNDLVTKKAPLIQDFNGFLKVLDPSLRASDHCLVLLYHRGAAGATRSEIESWCKPPMRPNLDRTIHRLVNEQDFVHDDGSRLFITRRGEQEVERRKLLEPE